MTVRIIVLALVSMTGIFGMLISSGMWDVVFFGLAALPILVASVLVTLGKMS